MGSGIEYKRFPYSPEPHIGCTFTFVNKPVYEFMRRNDYGTPQKREEKAQKYFLRELSRGWRSVPQPPDENAGQKQ